MIQLILRLALTPISTQSKVANAQPKQDGPVTTCQWPNTCASEEPKVTSCQYPNKCA